MPRTPYPSVYLSAYLGPLLLTLTGCLGMGLPEHFADSLQAKGPAQPAIQALVLAPLSIPDESTAIEHFGSQYVFGIIPLTRVYLQHSAQTLTAELLSEHLALNGYRTIQVEESLLEPASMLTRPSIIMSAHIQGLSLNAYDALFFRIISLTGNLIVDYYEPRTRQPAHREIVSLAETHYKAQAHAPLLAQLLKQRLQAALAEALTKIPNYRNIVPSSAKHANAGVVFIPPPIINHRLDDIGSLLASSYGFDSSPPFTSGAIARMIQRGMATGLGDLGISAALVTDPPVQIYNSATQSWEVISEVLELTINHETEQLTLVISGRIRECLSTTEDSAIARFTCTINQEAPPNIDGAWVAALESAGRQIGQLILSAEAPSAAPVNLTTGLPSINCQTGANS